MNIHSLREHPYSPGRSLTTLLIILVAAPVLSFILWKNNPLVAEENGFLESAQSIFLLLACFMHAEQAFRLKKTSLDFLIHAGLALLAYSFALRELDIDHFGSSAVWPLMEKTLRLVGVALWAGFLILLAPRMRQILSCLPLILTLRASALVIAGGLFFVAAWPFDKELFSALSQATSRFIEEVLELNACLLLFAASIARLSVRDAATDFESVEK